MNDEATKTMFESLSHIMRNQQKIMRHMGITKYDSDYGYDDERTEELIEDCYYMARQYEHDN